MKDGHPLRDKSTRADLIQGSSPSTDVHPRAGEALPFLSIGPLVLWKAISAPVPLLLYRHLGWLPPHLQLSKTTRPSANDASGHGGTVGSHCFPLQNQRLQDYQFKFSCPFSFSLSFKSSISKNKEHFLGLLLQGLEQPIAYQGLETWKRNLKFPFYFGLSIAFRKNTSSHFCFICFPYWFIYTALLLPQQSVHRFVIPAFPRH